MTEEYTLTKLGIFVSHHNVESLRMTYRKGIWEVNWQQKRGTRMQVEDPDFCNALAKFREEVAGEPQG
jgi:hypothetical protein